MHKKIKPTNITILGATLDTGNLGVSALLASTVEWIHQTNPNCKISLFDGDHQPAPQEVRLGDNSIVSLPRLGIRINKKIWKKEHIIRLIIEILLYRISPVFIKKKLTKNNPYLGELLATDLALDITGGDSFTDIYGPRRFLTGFIKKLLIIICKIDLILLPQTYGPFNSRWAKILTNYICRNTKAIYSRDEQGIEEITKLNPKLSKQLFFCPDVAFGLTPYPPQQPVPKTSSGKILIGLNVSGLLYQGGYNQQNMFDLKSDYKESILNIIETLLKQKTIAIILIPHVLPPPASIKMGEKARMEGDPAACISIYNKFSKDFPNQILYLHGDFDQSEIKWIIGTCDLLIGSRMHACIAAISQGIPAIALSYSKKFKGVYKSIDQQEYSLDLTTLSTKDITAKVLYLVQKLPQDNVILKNKIAQIKTKLQKTFNHILTKN